MVAQLGHFGGVSAKSKLEVFELIAEDEATSSYLARWNASTWIVLRRARHDEAARGMARLASIVQALEHPNVVRTLDPHGELGELESSVLLEEYVAGERLSDWMQALGAQRLPWRVAAAIVRDAALGAHAVQLACNSDARALSALWPDRLVVGFDGTVKVIDPAAELRGVPTPTEALGFLAPEAARGAPTASSVVYSLAQVLQLLRPGEGGDSADAEPKALGRILGRALAADVAERFRTPAELAAGLDALLDDPEPVRAFFEATFASERAAQGEALAELAASVSAPSANASGEFSDEVQTVVMNLEVPQDAPTSRQLADFDDVAETEELSLDALGLGSFVPDLDEDLRTRPFRRQLLSKLKKNEQETLERGGARVAVAPTAIPAPYRGAAPEGESVLLTDGAATGEIMAAVGAGAEIEVETFGRPKPPKSQLTPTVPAVRPKPSANETMVIRALTLDDEPERKFRIGDYLVLALATLVVGGIAFWVFSTR